MAGPSAEYEPVAQEGFWLVGREVRASNDDPGPIGALWGGLHTDPFRERVEGRLSDDVVSVYCEYEGDHTKPYTVFLGYRVPETVAAPEGLVRRHVPAGAFVRFSAAGEQPRTLMATWQEIWQAGLDRAFVADYEIHPAASPHEVTIHVGVVTP